MRGTTDRPRGPRRPAARGPRVAAALAFLALSAATPATAMQATEPEAIRRDAAELDALTAEVADALRCPVCRNQSVLESSSELARRMQSVIRERLAAGEEPEQVKAYFVERYGEWILLKPEPRGLNLAVYLLPAALVLGGGLLLRSRLRAWRSAGERTSADMEGDGATAEGAAGTGTRVGSVPAGNAGEAPGRTVREGADPGDPERPSGADLEWPSEADREWLSEAIREG